MPRYNKWSRKPPMGVRINQSSKFAQGLNGIWLFNEGGITNVYNLFGRLNDGTTGTGTMTNVTRKNNQVYFTPASSSKINVGSGVGTGAPSSNFTIIFRATRIASATTSGTAKVSYVFGSKNNTQTRGLEVDLGNGFGPIGDIDKPRVAVGTSETATIECWLNGVKQAGVNPFDTALTNGIPYIIAIRITGTLQPAAHTFGYGTNGTQSWFVNGSLDFMYEWNRLLSDNEIKELTSNPFTFLQPIYQFGER